LGYVIVDDYYNHPVREAVADFRRAHEIDDPIVQIDWTGVYWQRAGT
jgi:O-methyltransferase